MAKVTIGKWEVEEAELDQQHLAARERGQQQLATEAQAQRVTYDQHKDQLVLELKNGVTVLLPTHLLQGVAGAATEAIASVQVGPRGASLHWETLDVSFSLAGLLAGIFGTHVWMQEMGRIGGATKSVAKAVAARANGKQGGRPATKLKSPTPESPAPWL
jgi:Protein of unknown function (DUF2442)